MSAGICFRNLTCFITFMLICSISVISPVLAQLPDTSAQTSQTEVDLRNPHQEINKKALERLRRMNQEKVDSLDSTLAEALILYYDGKYGQALPIFNEIAKEAETLDIMWWIGTSAMKTGELTLAVQKFHDMLAADPSLHRVRMELAAVYFQMGRYDEARKELLRVKTARPPAEVEKNIDRLLSAIEEATRKVFWNIRFSQGFQYDSNISAGPDKKELDVSSGTLTLEDESKKLSDIASITNFGTSMLYKMSAMDGLMWNTAFDFYQAVYSHHGKFNYLLTDINTGPWWASRKDILKVPVGVSYQEYGNEKLSYITHIDPSYEHYFNPYFSLRGAFRYSKEAFYKDSDDNLKNITRRYEVSPSFYLANRQHIISLTAGYESSDADARRFSFAGPYYGMSYFTRFPTQTELFIRYQWSQKDYKEKPLLYDDYRIDRRHVVSAVISQGFYKHFFASFAFNYIDNSSSIELYAFKKETYTLSVGFYF